MSRIDFFPPATEPTLGELARTCGATMLPASSSSLRIRRISPLDLAGPEDLAFFDNRRYLNALRTTRAGAVLLAPAHSATAPESAARLLHPHPMHALSAVMAFLHPGAMRPGPVSGETGVSRLASVHATARLEPGVVVDAFAVIGPRVEIGAGTVVGPHAAIGADVRIGRDGSIGAGASVMAALIGDRVILHPGVRVGQDGFGFAMGPKGHKKTPQIGRVVIQDDVEIGAGTTIDRGANRDTMIGEGTKIDNLVQIGHNVVVGRHCVIVAQAGIAGSTVIEDFVAIGGQAGIAGHLRIGAGAQVAATAGVMHDIPAGEQWLGVPAAPAKEALRLHAALRKLASRRETSD